MNRSLPLISLLLLLLSSCKGPDETGQFKMVDADGWNYGDSIFFDVAAPDSVFRGDIAVVVRNSSAYDYSNVWLEMSYPPSDSIKPDTINFRLADVSGEWLGKGLGLSFQRVDTVVRDVRLNMPARLALRHIMRVDRLENIEQLGIILIPKAGPTADGIR